MKKILVLGAGLSASSMIKYLLDHAEQNNWKVIVADQSKELAEKKIAGHSRGEALYFDVFDEALRRELISSVHVVISMLPARFHGLVAEQCVESGIHMITASYISDQIKALDEQAREKGVLLLNEMGVDPGIDHMSAMQVIDRIRNSGGQIKEFESSTGGLVAPEHDNNPWNYKFTWNPRNVVIAGQGVSRFLHNGQVKYIPYHKLFSRTETVDILDYGRFEIYPNRDSLKYKDIYKLDGVKTLFRGTIRRPGYSKAWDVFVQLGMTDDSFVIADSEHMTYREFANSFLEYRKNMPLEKKMVEYIHASEDSDIMQKITWTGIFERKAIGLKRASPAQILQNLIESKWKLGSEERDMIIMQHKFVYEFDDTEKEIKSTMVVKGDSQVHTAMSITVGIPVAIAAKLLLQDRIKVRGVQLPVVKDVYEPVMEELADYGIRFIEEERLVGEAVES
ncbi:MAG: saccharopine dehydrogenase NADP-binding domain-containing protein [Bacteroidales bacterium]|nr:saccharopine dehydrogenase NADP-binding domain-containing protein [Bacteroidales bacterium]MCF8344300.1 saccharopine dehydrogenase NADP-binding domain-containing protein [Bacteroidales bacterium]MCF8377804.1 saccharopine dehydrogenase NADP-binding domain-containing protein [Bacteroidales bacterium]MCF8402174.1 saccharopine dehydrogenase NADP-binding domain-containing protein [Bacteroidales bacterium]